MGAAVGVTAKVVLADMRSLDTVRVSKGEASTSVVVETLCVSTPLSCKPMREGEVETVVDVAGDDGTTGMPPKTSMPSLDACLASGVGGIGILGDRNWTTRREDGWIAR